MANLNAPKGFSPIQHRSGAPWNEATNLYVIMAADTAVYSIGDPVKPAANADANGIPAVTKIATTATDIPIGVIVGVRPVDPGPSLVGTTLDLVTLAIPATKARNYYVFVVDDPDVWFEIQDDGLNAGNIVAANMNKNASYTLANPSFGPYSAAVLTSSTIATTQSHPLKLHGLIQRIDNAFGAFAKLMVSFNQHVHLGNTVGV